MIEVKDLMGKTHQVKTCTIHDIHAHFRKIKEFIPVSEVIEFTERMMKAVEEGTAFALSDDSCFLYYVRETERPSFTIGVALFGMGNPLKTAALFSAVFNNADTETMFMRFQTHPGKFVSEYKSLLTVNSIKRHDTTGDPLLIRVDKVRTKLKALTTKRGYE